MRRTVLLSLMLALLIPASASAAGVASKTGDVIKFVDAAGSGNLIRAVHPQDGDVNDIVFMDSTATASTGCFDYFYDPPDLPFPFPPNPPRKVGVRCDGNASTTVLVEAGEGDDAVHGVWLFFFCGSFFTNEPCMIDLFRPLTVEAGDGKDSVLGGDAANTLRGGAGDDSLFGGPVIDILDGAEGRDVLSGGTGTDDISGGSGIDEVSYSYASERVIVSLDATANDGIAGEDDFVRGDVEDVTGGSGPDILTGSGGTNTVSGGIGDDQIDGKGGFDAHYADEGADTVTARDGNRERVDCGDGSDVVTVDNADQLSGCETVNASDELEGDLDEDGFKEPADCNDRDADIKPGAADRPDNGVDENCDGADATIRDRDGDGFTPPADCDDANPGAKPGQREIFGNSVDEDCNGRADPLQSIASVVRASFREGAQTTVRRLQAAGVRAGTTVRVECKPSKRCPFKKARDFAVARDGELDLRAPLKLRRVRGGAKITITFLRSDSLAKRYVLTFRANKLPKTAIQCQRASNRRFGSCA